MNAANVVPFAKRRSLNARSALAYLARVAEGHPDGVVEVDNKTQLGTLLGWSQPRTSKQLTAWEKTGRVTIERSDSGKLLIRVIASRDDFERAGTPSHSTRAKRVGGTRAKRSTKLAVAPANPANFDNGSIARNDQLNSTGTQNMAKQTSAEDSPDKPSGASPTAPRSVPANARTSNNPVLPRVDHVDWRLLERTGAQHDRAHPMHFMDVLIVLIIFALTGVPAMLSINGMQGLFGGTPWEAFFLGCALELAKLGTSVWLSMRWDYFEWGHRLALVAFIFAIACINAISVYSQLVASHLSIVGDEQVAFVRSDADANGKLSLAQTRVSDVNSRISQIDTERAAIRGQSKKAIDARAALDQRRSQLVGDRDRAQRDLSDLQTSRSAGTAKHQATVNEAMPIQYVAEMLGIHKGGEEVIRWLIAGIVLCADPFALVLAHAFGSVRRTEGSMMARINIALMALLLAALSLTGVSAWMSINGMAVLFPADSMAIWLGVSLQAAKFTTTAWLSRYWAEIGHGHRILTAVFVVVIAALSAMSAFSYLVHAQMTESTPIMRVAELLGIQGDEELIRWFIASIVACADLFVLTLLAAIASRRWRAV